jgi:hypothetical protein
MLTAIARFLFRRDERAFSPSRLPSGVAPIAPVFQPPSTPGALPKPAHFTFSPDRNRPLERDIQAALPSRASVQIRFWGAVLVVLLMEVIAIQTTRVDIWRAWLFLGSVPMAAVFGGMAGWAHVMAHATDRLPDVLRAALREMPSRYETMRQAKAERGVRAPLWLSFAIAGIMANVVWPITTQALRERLGVVQWLPLRPVRRVFSSSAQYASTVIRNEHTRYQHLQSVLTPVSVPEVAWHDVDATEQDSPVVSESAVQLDEWKPAHLNGQSESATHNSIRDAVNACMGDIEQATAADARRLWWTMTTFAALTYATALTLLAVAWLLG